MFSQEQHLELSRTVRACMALPFVPISRIDEAFQIAQDHSLLVHPNIEDRTQDFMEYMKSTWLYGPYSPLSWNFYAYYMQKTNNVSEGYNHAFNSNKEFGGTTTSPNIYTLIKVIKKELLRTQERATMYEIGQDPRTHKDSGIKEKQKQEQRLALMLKLSNGKIQLPQYLEAVGRSSLLTFFEVKRYEEIDYHKDSSHNLETDFDISTPPTTSNKKSNEKTSGRKSNEKTSGHKNSSSKTSDKKSNEKTSGHKNSSSKTSDKKSSDKTSQTKKSTERNSDNKSNEKKTGTQTTSGKKPTTVALFEPIPDKRTPKKRYLTAEPLHSTKAKRNYYIICILVYIRYGYVRNITNIIFSL